MWAKYRLQVGRCRSARPLAKFAFLGAFLAVAAAAVLAATVIVEATGGDAAAPAQPARFDTAAGGRGTRHDCAGRDRSPGGLRAVGVGDR